MGQTEGTLSTQKATVMPFRAVLSYFGGTDDLITSHISQYASEMRSDLRPILVEYQTEGKATRRYLWTSRRLIRLMRDLTTDHSLGEAQCDHGRYH